MNTVKDSQIKSVKSFCDDLFSTPDYCEVLENLLDGETDFEVDNVRFINENDIDEIQADELTSDLYVLGCFNASFIADQCNWPLELIEAAQKDEAFEALGQAIKDHCDMVEFAQAYSSADGYGHHFNGYDFGEDTLKFNGNTYYVFDQH